MKTLCTRAFCFGLACSAVLLASESPSLTQTAPEPTPKTESPELSADRYELEALSTKNKLVAERITAATNAAREQIAQLKIERELLLEKQALEDLKREGARKEQQAKADTEKDQLERDNELAKTRADKYANELKALQNQASMELTRLQNEVACIEAAKKRSEYANTQPVYLTNPLKDNGILVVSDRRIPLNGLITTATADYITNRIQYWNNKDRKLPIFLIIDASPGGSVMAGYRILKAMESSEAPVHVVVKSFAASMAAAITTLATESYAYPNAVILHHQISSMMMGQLNLTQQREFHQESQRWWDRLGTPVAMKMGLTTDELVKQMYAHSSSGDWSEFGQQALQLKWVNHIVNGIDETSITRDPDAASSNTKSDKPAASLTEEVDANGKPFAWLPHLDPKDVYFLYNPESYYRLR